MTLSLRSLLPALSLSAGLLEAQTVALSPASWTPADLRADLAQLRAHVAEGDKSYAPAAREAALRRVDALAAAVDTIRPVSFELEVARIIALADNGHSNVPGPTRGARYNRAGIRLMPFGTRWIVLRARAPLSDLIGARVVAIDGHPVESLRRAAHTLTGGPANWRDRFAPHFLESPEQLHASGIAHAPERATYRFELPGGRVVDRELVAEPAPPTSAPRVPAARWMYPDSTAGDGTPWVGVLDTAKAPWALQRPLERFRFRRAPEVDGAVIEFRQNQNSPGHDISRFIAATVESLAVVQPRNVVLDMRMNGGGNLNTTRSFVQNLPRTVPGRIFALTSAGTFSAAISTVGYLKQAARDRVSIVGEEVGDRLEFWAEGRPIILERTGIRIGTATERHDYANGCKAYRDCHGGVVRNPIAVATLTPDIPAPWTFEAYRAGRDPAMEAVVAALAGGRR